MLKSTIGIDLGASYTKVAYRKSLTRTGRHQFAEGNTDLVLSQGSAMIPSVMIQTGDRKQPWLAGAIAAGTTPTAGMHVYENWKSDLYSSDFNARKVNLVFVAGRFFEWLHNELTDVGVDFSGHCCVRVTIPALERIEQQKEALIQCMKLNGWPEDISVVLEPCANIIGVLSAGRNIVSAAGQISYQRTFGDADPGFDDLNFVFNEIKKFARGTRKERYMNISVVDCGSFTLDVAKMTMDLDASDHDKFPIEDVVADGWEIGVMEQIDKQCLEKIFNRKDVDGKQLSFVAKETIKRTLYAGDIYALPGTRKILGDDEQDKESVIRAIDSYCDQSFDNILSRCQDSELVVLTGGGINIPRLRQSFCEKLQRNGAAHVVAFSTDTTLVESSISRKSICELKQAGDGLGRLATSLGGASIGFGFEPDEKCKQFQKTTGVL